MQLQAGQQFAIVTRGNIIELVPIRTIESARGMLATREYVPSDYRDGQERKMHCGYARLSSGIAITQFTSQHSSQRNLLENIQHI